MAIFQQRLGFHQKLDGRFFFDLGAHGRRTADAEILVLVSLRQNQEKLFPHRYGRLTPGTIERGRLKLIKTTLSPHETIINDR